MQGSRRAQLRTGGRPLQQQRRVGGSVSFCIMPAPAVRNFLRFVRKQSISLQSAVIAQPEPEHVPASRVLPRHSAAAWYGAVMIALSRL